MRETEYIVKEFLKNQNDIKVYIVLNEIFIEKYF